jgi:hypothetical protein
LFLIANADSVERSSGNDRGLISRVLFWPRCSGDVKLCVEEVEAFGELGVAMKLMGMGFGGGVIDRS